MLDFDNLEVERYSRQIIIPQIGGAGQQELKGSTVLVVGMGGLGNLVASYLVASGVGRLIMVDDDEVSLSNLARQVLFDSTELGMSKVSVARSKLQKINPLCKIEAVEARFSSDYRDKGVLREFFDSKNHQEWQNTVDALDSKNSKNNKRNEAQAHISNKRVCIDATDNLSSKYLLAGVCHKHGIPLVLGAVQKFSGYVTTLMPYAKIFNEGRQLYLDAPRLEDLFKFNGEQEQNCDTEGIMGYVVAMIASMQVNEASKLMLNLGSLLVGKIWLIDTLDNRFQILSYSRVNNDQS